MRFQTDDIIKSTGGNFSKVRTALGEKVVAGLFWSNIEGARKDQEIDCILTEAELADYTIVERNGKPYEPERWVPEDGELYYYPDPTSQEQIGFVYHDVESPHDCFLSENGLCYPFTKEGKQAAIARTKRMLAVK